MTAVPPITVPVVLDVALHGLDVCEICQSVVTDLSAHDGWHGSLNDWSDRIDDQTRRLDGRLARLAPPPKSDLWKPQGSEYDPVTLQVAVMQAVGTGSTCWSNVDGAGVFDAETATWVGEGLLRWIEERYTRKENR